MEKIILDTNQRKKSGDFVLNLNGILGIKDINLNIDNAIEDLNKEIENKNFEKAEEYSNLLFKISDYGDRKVDFARVIYFYNKIIYNYENLDRENIIDFIKINKEINSFMSFIISLRYDDLNDFTTDKVRKVKEIKNELDITEVIKERYKSSYDKVTIEDIRIINEAEKVTRNDEIIEIKKKLEEELKKKLDIIKTSDEIEVVKRIKEILINEYEKDFFASHEFLNITLDSKYREFESKDTLLEFTNKAYLVYRFNESNTKDEKIKELITYGIDDFINLPTLFREVIVEKVSSVRDRYNIVEEFFTILHKEINDIKNIRNINFLPI